MQAQATSKPVVALVVALFLVALQPGAHPSSPAATVSCATPCAEATSGPGTTAARGTRGHRDGVGLVDINTRLPRAAGAGTGIVLGATGIVATNNHVIDGATSITATDPNDGRTYRADVVGTDPRDDIALLRLRGATALPVAVLGDSDNVQVGDHVEAIGNAGGRGGAPTITAGEVIALDRSVVARDDYQHSSQQLRGLIEVDASVQPGDSGGPLVGTAGVIGMDTAASDQSGFAIPINTVIATVHRLAVDPTASSAGHGRASPPAGDAAGLDSRLARAPRR
jgi:S1-C subfamily serine protease